LPTPPTLELPITIRKGTCSSYNPNPLYIFTIIYKNLSPSYFSFVSLDFVAVPKTTSEAMVDPDWRQAMVEEMVALHSNGCWEFVPLPLDKKTISYHLFI